MRRPGTISVGGPGRPAPRPADWGEKRAAHAGASGTASLTVTHTAVRPNYSTQGIAVLANSLAPNAGTIRSASGTDAELAHAGRGHDASHKADYRPEISVVDARAKEGPDAAAFEVSLSRALTGAKHPVNLDPTRHQPANSEPRSGAGSGAGTPVEHGIVLRGTVRWQAARLEVQRQSNGTSGL